MVTTDESDAEGLARHNPRRKAAAGAGTDTEYDTLDEAENPFLDREREVVPTQTTAPRTPVRPRPRPRKQQQQTESEAEVEEEMDEMEGSLPPMTPEPEPEPEHEPEEVFETPQHTEKQPSRKRPRTPDEDEDDEGQGETNGVMTPSDDHEQLASPKASQETTGEIQVRRKRVRH